jgi:hypothetical protein
MAKLKEKLVAEKLRKYHGNLSAVARAFGVGRSSVSEFVSRRPNLVAVRDECTETLLDDG